MSKTIIAEDNKHLRESYEMSFEIRDLEVETVSNGEELVQKVKSGNYNLAITDNDMGGGITGINAVSEIRKFNKEIPLFVCSNSSEIEKKCLEAGATGFIDKEKITGEGIDYFFDKLVPYLE